LILVLMIPTIGCGSSIKNPISGGHDEEPVLGIEQSDRYLPLLKGKSVGVVSNHTSMINGVHLVDTLLSSGISIKKVFGPEHGFRGSHGAGDVVGKEVDEKTSLPIISLYGKNKKPTHNDFSGLDVIVFDIQDVGARFYTYISTLFYVMETCSELDLPLIILDRPNPHGGYEDGPILDIEYQSFVGICKLPIVHGLTIGEFAKMVNGERWLNEKLKANLTVIDMKGYEKQKIYDLPIPPSPNLQDMDAILLYPSLCFFEGTKLSIGRGTSSPFKVFGYPHMTPYDTVFVPKSIEGVARNPPFEGEVCNGIDATPRVDWIRANRKLDLSMLLDAYDNFPDQDNFFNPFFDKLAGTNELREQIQNGETESQIRESWEKGLAEFRAAKSKYELY